MGHCFLPVPPGSSTQALYWAGTWLGPRPIPTVWPKHARLLFRYLPAFVGIHAACAVLDRWSQGGYVDFLVSLFSRSSVFSLFCPPSFFFYEESFAGTDTRILALADNYRAWTQLQAMNCVEKRLTQHWTLIWTTAVGWLGYCMDDRWIKRSVSPVSTPCPFKNCVIDIFFNE